jgi:cyclohexanecarboxyl-CoA dehydrogenase
LLASEHGELDFVRAGLAIEELAFADPCLAQASVIAMFTSALLTEHASSAVRDRLVPGLLAGRQVVGFGLSEPDSGADAAGMCATARPSGDGWVLNGSKTSITMPAHADAVTACLRDEQAGGISAFVIDTDLPGVHRERTDDTSWRPLGRGTLVLDDVVVGREALLGPAGDAFGTVLNGLDYTRPLLVLNAIGCASGALHQTVAFVRERQAFGSALADFEGVSFPLAEHATQLEAARLLAYATLADRAAGRAHTARAAMAKYLGPLVASRAVHDCMLLRGHPAFTRELDLEQRLRDVMAFEVADGPAQIQKIIIARELFGREFVPYRRSR